MKNLSLRKKLKSNLEIADTIDLGSLRHPWHLPFSAMTLSRAVKQLETVGLFTVTKDGVNKVIESKYDKQELFEKVKDYLSTPVRKVGYIEKPNHTAGMIIAGETALAEKTMLNPSRIITYAVDEKAFDKKLLTDELIAISRSSKRSGSLTYLVL